MASIWNWYKIIESEINFLKSTLNNLSNIYDKNIKFYGSILIPSKQFISRFKFRPWKGVYISEKYLNSLEYFYNFTKDLIDLYYDNNICPVIETDFCSSQKLEKIYTLFKNSINWSYGEW